MKRLLIAGLLLIVCSPVFALEQYNDTVNVGEADPVVESTEPATWSKMFMVTENAMLDWAIASSLEVGYFRDMIGGRNAIGGQFPIVYVTPYLSADFGYVTGYEEKSRGALMFGGSLRLNKIIEDMYHGEFSFVRKLNPTVDSNWERLWVGPYVAHGFTENELLAGIKAGLAFEGLFGW